jgi:flagellar biosynthesis protein FlhA
LEPHLEEPLGYEIKIVGVVERSSKLEKAGDFGPLLKDLYEVLTRFAWQLLGYREVEALLEGLEKRHRTLYQSLFPDRLSIPILRQILRNLLKEGLPIRDLARILEILSESSAYVQDPDQLTEFVRAGFGRQICQQFSDDKGVLHAILVDPSVENELLKQVHESSAALWLELDLDSSLRLLRSADKGVAKAQQAGHRPVVLCSPRPRRFLRRLLEPTFPQLPVLAFSEIAPLTEVSALGSLSL